MNFIINRKTLISMLFIGLSLLGYISWQNLPMELFPNAELPVLFVQVNTQTEVDPKYMENQAIIPLEGAIGTMQGIENLQSTAQSQRGTIVVEFKKNVNFKYTYLKLQEKIDEAKQSLPEEFRVTVMKVDLDQMNNQFMELQVRGSGGVDRVRNETDQEVVPDLENIDGVAGVTIYGGREKSIEVRLKKAMCEAYGITPATIRSKIAQSYRTRAFAGNVYQSNRQFIVHVNAEYTDIKSLENLVIADGPILLKDVANVYFGVKEETSYSRVNGKDAVTVRLVNDAQANLIDVSHKTLDVVKKLNEKLASKDIEIVVQNNTAQTMEDNINQIIELALVGGLLAVLVLWIFLKNFQLVSVIALAIPISVYAAFNFFYAADITINSLTLVGMALAIGMLLDNSVVVLENIYRLRSQGLPPAKAVIQGTTEVWRSIVAATLTTITVFLPFLFSDNYLISLIGKNVGVSIISTLTISLFVALLLVPMMAHYFLTRKKSTSINFNQISTRNPLIQGYVMVLKNTLRSPARTIIGALVFFFLTIFILLAVSVNNLSEVETNDFQIYVTMPSGSTLESTDKVVSQIESRLEPIEEKQDVVSKIEEDNAVVTVTLKDDYKKTSKRSIAEIKSDVENRVENISGAEISVDEEPASAGNRGGGGGGSFGGGGTSFMRLLGVGTNWERILIKGQDFETMKNVASDFQYYLESLESMRRVQVSYSDNRPEVHLEFHPLLLTAYDIPLANIASELNSFNPEINTNVPFKQGTDEYDIIIRDEDAKDKKERSADDLRHLLITDANGGTHELQSVADVVFSSGYAKIDRVNQEKQIEVRYRFIDEAQDSKTLLDAYRMEVDQIVANYNLPSGVAVQVIHEEDDLQEFYFLILAAFVLILMILASVFESLSTPFVLMFSIPLAAIGSFLALIFTGNSLFNANTLTGFLILLGVVVNNGIILIDYTGILRKRGYRKERALITAGMSRIRPILITAITTIVAMMPLAMGDNEYVGAIGAPFAITVIGGLSVSTLLTLIFIPTFYFGLENAINWVRKLDLRIQILQILLYIGGCVLIFTKVDTFMWQMVDLVGLTVLIPGTTWFVKNSLRKATETVVEPDVPIQIRIQNLVKIYDRGNRFIREWKGNRNIRERKGELKTYHSWRDFDDFVWELPLLGFLTYFTFSYLDSGWWMFVMAHFVFLMALSIWRRVQLLLAYSSAQSGKDRPVKIGIIIHRLLYWGLPAVALALFYLKWETIGSVVMIAVLWYFVLAVKVTADKLYRDKVNIERLKGRFAGLRRLFFKLVEQIPVIGRKHDPFKALRGVSLDIGTGMIGLLGPNGAGKSTMMRVICGIYDQSYGKVWINGVDTQLKREELQGLIGYLPQEFGTYENMSAWEFLDYQAMLKGLSDKDAREARVQYVLEAVHLWDKKDDKIGSFSGGMKQRIGIAQILLHLPRILVVDEPTAGLDPRERIRFRNLLVELSRERVVIFSTHVIEDISSSCNQVAVINRGELRYTGHPNNMLKLADGLVWQFLIPAKEFDAMEGKDRVVHHMRDGDQIKVRYISAMQPAPDAVPVKPVLEEAYLCLLKGIQKENS